MNGPAGTKPEGCWALVLAAGASQRLGQAKQEIIYHGKTLLARTLDQARACCNEVLVVLGHRAQVHVSSLADDVHHVVNPHWATGMGGSIAWGIRALPDQAQAVLIMLCDQYRLQPAHYCNLIDHWNRWPTQPCAAFYANRAGVPVLFPRPWFARLAALEGERGIGTELQGNDITRCPLPLAAYDLDTPEDLIRLNREQSKPTSD